MKLQIVLAMGFAIGFNLMPDFSNRASGQERIDQLRDAELIAQFPVASTGFQWSPDDAWVAANAETGVQLIDLSDNSVVESEELSTATAWRFSPETKFFYFGGSRGKIHRFDLPSRQIDKTVDLGLEPEEGAKAKLTYLCVSEGGLIGWAMHRAEVVGLFNFQEESPIDFKDNVVTSFGSGPAILLSQRGKYAMFRYRARGLGVGPGRAMIWDLENEEAVHSPVIYVAKETMGAVETPTGFAFGHRANHVYSIRHFDFETGEETVIDDAARKGHFIDLYLSPSKRWLCESDFEKRGLKIYDLENEHEPRVLNDESRGLLGFDRFHDIAFSRKRGAGFGNVIQVWDLASGEKLGEIAFPGLGTVHAVQTNRAGDRMMIGSRMEKQSKLSLFEIKLADQ